MNHKFYLYARFKSMDANKYYVNNKNYLLMVLVNRFNGRTQITDTATGLGVLRYETKEDFEKSWKLVEDKTLLVKSQQLKI